MVRYGKTFTVFNSIRNQIFQNFKSKINYYYSDSCLTRKDRKRQSNRITTNAFMFYFAMYFLYITIFCV